MPVFIRPFVSPIADDTTAQVLITAAILFMMLDVLFGAINASMHGEFDSGIMRAGIGHKCAEMGFILIGVIVDAVISVGVEVPIGIEGPILKLICIGILLMELGSMMEIWALMNPKLKTIKIFQILASVHIEEKVQEDADE